MLVELPRPDRSLPTVRIRRREKIRTGAKLRARRGKETNRFTAVLPRRARRFGDGTPHRAGGTGGWGHVVEFVPAEGVPQIRAANRWVVDDLARRAFGEDAALVDDQRAVAHFQRLRHVVIRDQHALVEL